MIAFNFKPFWRLKISRFNAASALSLVFDDEEAGDVSDDELPDEVEDA